MKKVFNILLIALILTILWILFLIINPNSSEIQGIKSVKTEYDNYYTEIDKILSEHQPFRKIEIPEGIFIHINKMMLKINFDEDLYNYLKNCLLFTFFPAFPLSFNETLDIATNLIKKGKYLKYQIRKK